MKSRIVVSAMSLPPPDHDQMVRGQLHLTHQVAGEEDRTSLSRQGLHQIADPGDALGVEAVGRLVKDQRPG